MSKIFQRLKRFLAVCLFLNCQNLYTKRRRIWRRLELHQQLSDMLVMVISMRYCYSETMKKQRLSKQQCIEWCIGLLLWMEHVRIRGNLELGTDS